MLLGTQINYLVVGVGHRDALFFMAGVVDTITCYSWLAAIDVQVLLASTQVGSTTGCMCTLRQCQLTMVLKWML